jgi:hypothetical protein
VDKISHRERKVMVLLIMLVLWKNGNEQNARVEFAGAKFLSNGLRNPRKCPRHFVLKDLKKLFSFLP